MKSSPAKWKKILGVAAAVVALIVMVLSYKFVSALPSKSDIAGALKSVPPIDSADQVKQANKPVSQAADAAKEQSPTESPTPTAKKPEDKKAAMAALMNLLEEDPRDIRVCDQLSESKLDFSKKSNFEFDQMFGSARVDPAYEAFRVPMKALLQEPNVAGLLREVEELSHETENKAPKEKESFLQKIGFYSRVAKSAAALYGKKEQFESLGDRAVHLMLLAQVASTRSEFKDDSQLMDFCKKIQNSDLTLDRGKIIEERKELLSMLKEKGLEPKDLDFDPENWIKLSVKTGKNGFNFNLSSRE